MNDVEYYDFIWDKDKASLNKKKHNVSFEVAAQVFNDPYLLELFDEKHSFDEERYKYIGSVCGELVLFVIAMERNNKIRIISARKATKKERNYYYENIKKIWNY